MSAPTLIKRDASIGSGANILANVTIGEIIGVAPVMTQFPQLTA